MKKVFVAMLVIAAAMMMVYGTAAAKVTGACSNCHTMHDSQNGVGVANSTLGAAGGLEGAGAGDDKLPIAQLLKTTCVGCHSSTTSSTIVEIGTGSAKSRVPIVWNTVAPVNPLAGGNFFWAENAADDTLAHNVYGIMGVDTVQVNPNAAPGLLSPTNTTGESRCSADSCHGSLAHNRDVAPGSGPRVGGCQGCHSIVMHHGLNPDGTAPYALFTNTTTTDDGGSLASVIYYEKYTFTEEPFRFLAGHRGSYVGKSTEGANWEQGGVEENKYWGAISDATSTSGTVVSVTDSTIPGFVNSTNTVNKIYSSTRAKTVSKYCDVCHTYFHGDAGYQTSTDVNGQAIWIRHPSDKAATLAPASYSNQTPTGDTVGDGSGTAVVMCLSCHRAHGTDQPDMLRFTMSNAGVASTGGCLNCHVQQR